MRKKLLVASVIVIVVALYVSVNRVRLASNQGDRDDLGSAMTYGADYSNPRVLVGYAQEVFAARILQETGSVPQSLPGGGQLPHYQYEAEVLYSIKGTASGKIMLDLEALDGARLNPSNTYLFAARHWAETEPWYYIGSPSPFHVLISDNTNLASEELNELIRKHPRTYELLNAYPNEILRDVDIQKNRAVNSFSSLSDETKQAIYAKFDELIPRRPVPEVLPTPSMSSPTSEESTDCIDGKDNDNDGVADQADPDCLTYYREDLPSFCRDLEDNDRDGLKDAADPDCAPFYPQSAPLPPLQVPSST